MIPLAAILVVATLGFFTLGDYLGFDVLRENRDALTAFRDRHFLASSLVFLTAYAVIVAFSLPGGAVASLTGGFLFGLFPGTLYNVSAATGGAVIIFLAARWGLGAHLAKRMEDSDGIAHRIRRGLMENELSFLFIMRLVPAIPFFAANLIPALVGVRLPRFAFTTFFGIIPGALVYTWIGAGLGSVFERGETPDLGIIFEPQILGPILALAALALLPVILKRLNKNGKV